MLQAPELGVELFKVGTGLNHRGRKHIGEERRPGTKFLPVLLPGAHDGLATLSTRSGPNRRGTAILPRDRRAPGGGTSARSFTHPRWWAPGGLGGGALP
ncbi:MAG: hypothetical protein OHK0015_42260 [Chloroflexi bacterium OHK40]